jgi:predicted dehydrogenase
MAGSLSLALTWEASMKKTCTNVSRRDFLRATGAGVTLFHVVPAHVLGGPGKTPPSDKLNIAAIGAGGRAADDIDGVKSENIVALADVDDRRAAETYAKYPAAKRYRDYRQMLDQMDKQIDAVVVGTPDHTHAVAVIDAIGRGKHVYCEKPLAHSIHEVRAMMHAARQHNVITQMGNQGHSSDDIRLFCEWIWDGAIGKVSEIHAACDAFKELYCQIDKLPALQEKHPIPSELDWDLWLGPSQPRAYHPMYVPFTWRGWMPFGTGCVGDWICHIVDPSMWALELGAPTTIQAEVDSKYDPVRHVEMYPSASRITYEFPAKGQRGPVKLVWHDGNRTMPRPELLSQQQNVPGTGAIVYGDAGAIMHGSHGAGGCRLLPEQKGNEYPRPAQKIARVKNHYADWLDAIRAGRQASSSFDYGGPLTELGLLGAIAVRFPTQKLEWDAGSARFANFSDANVYINPPYRQGWSL